MLRSMELVSTAFSVSVTRDLISTILCGIKVLSFTLQIEIGNLEVSYQPLHQTSSVHVPHDDLLPDARHGKLVLRRENDVVGVVELLADVSHSIRELQCNAPA